MSVSYPAEGGRVEGRLSKTTFPKKNAKFVLGLFLALIFPTRKGDTVVAGSLPRVLRRSCFKLLWPPLTTEWKHPPDPSVLKDYTDSTTADKKNAGEKMRQGDLNMFPPAI